MKKVFQKNNFIFLIVIFSALCIQAVGHYYAHSFRIGRYFYVSWVFLRILIPCLMIPVLGIPFREIGIRMPMVDPRIKKILIYGILGLLGIFIVIQLSQSYQQSYSHSFHSGDRNSISRLVNFLIFTASTLTGWEFLHRGFLLRGIVYSFKRDGSVDEDTGNIIAIAVVAIFEVMFHFTKPGLEVAGMLVGSPILSYIALRTGSIWIPLLLHFIVEMLFILSLIF